MASGWTNSGIDWTSVATMRNSRTEDVVREIYLAVNERDYWIQKIKFLDFSGYALVLDEDGKIRIDSALRYIQETVSGWFLPIDDFVVENNNEPMFSKCCFLDDSFIPTGNPQVIDSFRFHFYGFKNLDYTQSGNFETQYSIDLSLLRNPPNRVNLDYLKLIYDILQLNLKTSVDNWTSFNNGQNRFGVAPTQDFGDTLTDNNYSFEILDYNESRDSDFSQLVTDMNSNANLEIDGGSGFRGQLRYTLFDSVIPNELRIITFRTMKAYKIAALNKSFDITELNPSSLVTSGEFRRDDLNVIPFSNTPNGYYKNSLYLDELTQARMNNASSLDPIINAGFYYVVDSVKTSFDFYDIPGGTGGSSESQVNASFFVEFNKEDFLNYYTEPTP